MSTLSVIFKGAIGVLTAVAPTIATCLGGPLAGTAVSAIIKALGLAPDTPPDQVAAVVANATPEQLLLLKQAEYAYLEQMHALDIEVGKLIVDDRASARSRETTVKDSVPGYLGVLTVVGFFVYCGWVSYTHPESGVINLVIGFLAANASAVYGYFYGGSSDLMKLRTPEPAPQPGKIS